MRTGLQLAGIVAASVAGVALTTASIAQSDKPDDAAISLPDLAPGSYEETVRFVSVSGDAPPELKAAMRSRDASVTQFCFMPGAAGSKPRSIFEAQAGKDCRQVAGTVAGDRVSAGLVCEDSGSKGTIEFDGTAQQTSASFQVKLAVDFKNTNRKMAYATEVTWRRTAATCDAAG